MEHIKRTMMAVIMKNAAFRGLRSKVCVPSIWCACLEAARERCSSLGSNFLRVEDLAFHLQVVCDEMLLFAPFRSIYYWLIDAFAVH